MRWFNSNQPKEVDQWLKLQDVANAVGIIDCNMRVLLSSSKMIFFKSQSGTDCKINVLKSFADKSVISCVVQQRGVILFEKHDINIDFKEDITLAIAQVIGIIYRRVSVLLPMPQCHFVAQTGQNWYVDSTWTALRITKLAVALYMNTYNELSTHVNFIPCGLSSVTLCFFGPINIKIMVQYKGKAINLVAENSEINIPFPGKLELICDGKQQSWKNGKPDWINQLTQKLWQNFVVYVK